MKGITSIRNVTLLLLLPLVIIGTACQNKAEKKRKSPPGYDLAHPEVISLSKKIDEISGIIYNSSDSSLFAIDDNQGNLYKLELREDAVIQKWMIGEKADFEDIASTDASFYMLASKGRLIAFPRSLPPGEIKEYTLSLNGFTEFETLYYEAAKKRLIMLCKECEQDNDQYASAYAFDLTTNSFADTPVLKLSRAEVEKIAGEKTGRLKVSAAAVNPITGEVYIVSSVNKLLIVTDPAYHVKATYDLKRSRFEQPEGLCFSPNGTLFISNEAGKDGQANILIFKREGR